MTNLCGLGKRIGLAYPEYMVNTWSNPILLGLVAQGIGAGLGFVAHPARFNSAGELVFQPILLVSEPKCSWKFQPYPAETSHVERLECHAGLIFVPLLLGLVVWGFQGAMQSWVSWTVSSWEAPDLESDRRMQGSVAALWGGRSELPYKFSPHCPRKERKCLPPSYRLWALPSTGDCLYQPCQVPYTPARNSSVGKGREAQSRGFQSVTLGGYCLRLGESA